MEALNKDNLNRLVSVLKNKNGNIPFHRYTDKKFSVSWWMVELMEQSPLPLEFYQFKAWGLTYFGITEKEFEWLFSPKWQIVDTSSNGLCDRISMLMLGFMPEDWSVENKGY